MAKTQKTKKVSVKEKATHAKEQVQTWSEKHPKLAKAGKGAAIGLGALAIGTVGFLLGHRSKEVINSDDCPPDVDFTIDE